MYCNVATKGWNFSSYRWVVKYKSRGWVELRLKRLNLISLSTSNSNTVECKTCWNVNWRRILGAACCWQNNVLWDKLTGYQLLLSSSAAWNQNKEFFLILICSICKVLLLTSSASRMIDHTLRGKKVVFILDNKNPGEKLTVRQNWFDAKKPQLNCKGSKLQRYI